MRDAYSVDWIRENHLPAALVESVHGLNHRFLDLAVTGAASAASTHWPAGTRMGLAAEVSARFAPLSAAQKAAAAGCPYALFDLRFHDDAHWRARFGTCGSWVVADEARAADDTVEFVRLALFFAWHVAAAGELAAPWLLGMSDGTVAAFRAATIDSLSVLAATETVNLTARWNSCSAYWGALAAAAAQPDSPGLRKVQLYGLQLAAAARLR